jgi:hypothetical protein
LFLLGIILTPTFKVEAGVVTVTANYSSSPITVKSGDLVTIRWQADWATSCENNFNSSTAINGSADIYTTLTKTFTVTCNTVAPSCSFYYATCFTSDTVITLADGTKKNIQDVKFGDVLKGEKTNNKVLGFHQPKLNGKLYSFNGGRYFVTEEHPFKTIDGWKSINPDKTKKENIGIMVTELKVGDTLIADNGLVKIKTINSKSASSDTSLYNFILDGDHTYYADGYLVHNKLPCDSSNPCADGVNCLSVSGSYDQGQITSGPGSCGVVCHVGYTCLVSGYKSFCDGNNIKCGSPSSSSVCVPVSDCNGTVSGSCSANGATCPGPYEGQSCKQFYLQSECQPGNWLTKGCTWLAS